MSHTVTIATKLTDPAAIAAACRRLQLPAPEAGTYRLYDGGEVTGLRVQLPDWHYPLVCQPNGQLQFDNFGGRWGAEAELHRFQQAYAVEKARMEALKQGHSVYEQSLPDGSVKLTINVPEYGV